MVSPLRVQRKSPALAARLGQPATLERLAALAGVTAGYLSRLETGAVRTIDVLMARKIAEAYQCPIEAVEVTVHGEKGDWRTFLDSPQWKQHWSQAEDAA